MPEEEEKIEEQEELEEEGENDEEESEVDDDDEEDEEEGSEEEDETEEEEEEIVDDITEKLVEGLLLVQEENDKGKFVGGKKYYAKFLFKGRFVAFFASKELKNIPVFYIKMKYIMSIEDFFNNNPAYVFIEFYDGKKEKRILLVITEMKEKDSWVDTMQEQKTNHEDDEDNEDEDYGRSQLEMRYLLAEEYESKLNRLYPSRKP